MSRVTYAFNEEEARHVARPVGRKLKIPKHAKLRNRRILREAMQATGLFIFGYGATGLVMHLAAGFFLVSRAATFLPQFAI